MFIITKILTCDVPLFQGCRSLRRRELWNYYWPMSRWPWGTFCFYSLGKKFLGTPKVVYCRLVTWFKTERTRTSQDRSDVQRICTSTGRKMKSLGNFLIYFYLFFYGVSFNFFFFLNFGVTTVVWTISNVQTSQSQSKREKESLQNREVYEKVVGK